MLDYMIYAVLSIDMFSCFVLTHYCKHHNVSMCVPMLDCPCGEFLMAPTPKTIVREIDRDLAHGKHLTR